MKYFILVAFVLGLASAKVDKFAKNCATVGRSFDGLFTQQVCEFDCLYFGRNVGCSSNGTEYCRHHQCTNTNLAFRQTTIEKRFNHMEKLDLNLTNFRYEICFDVEEINLDQTPISNRSRCTRCTHHESTEGGVISIFLTCTNLRHLVADTNSIAQTLVMETYGGVPNNHTHTLVDVTIVHLDENIVGRIKDFEYAEHLDLGRETFTQEFMIKEI